MGFPNVCMVCERPFLTVDKPKQHQCPLCRDALRGIERQAFTSLIRQLNRAKKAGVPATLTWKAWQQTLQDFLYFCAYCGKRYYHSLEHLISIEQSGGTSMGNCLPSCN